LTCIADCADANIARHTAKCLSRITGARVYE